MSKKRTFDGEKSVLDIRKAEERELSDQIHQSFQFLNIMYPRNFEFQHYFARDMFLKPNTKALPFVMHYLFNILDPIEFKKRFYWPLDKTSENAFRTTTVQYLNYLNEKHNLGWGEIKAFLVVMPGGMKFMKLLADLMNFVVDEEIKKCEKSLPESINKNHLQLTQENLKGIIKSYETFVNKATAYKEKIDFQKAVLKQNTSHLNNELHHICKDISASPEDLDETFFQKYESANCDLFEKIVVRKVDEIVETEKYLDDLSAEIDRFHSGKHKFPCDKDLLVSSYRTIQADYPELYAKDILTADNKIQLDALLDAFNCIFPALHDTLGQYDLTQSRIDKYEFEVNEVCKLENDAMQLDGDIFKFESTVDNIKIDLELMTKSEDADKSVTPNRKEFLGENTVKQKFVYTPAIYVESDNIMPAQHRLPFLEDNMESSFNFGNQTTLALPKSAHVKNLSFTGNSSKILDPLTLLRTVTKSTNRKKKHRRMNSSHLAGLASRYRENEELFVVEKENLSETVIGTINYTETPVIRKKCSSFSREALTVDRRHAIRETLTTENQQITSSGSVVFNQRRRTKSVQKIDMNSLSKSPSGRLDPLISVKHCLDIPDVSINDTMITSDALETCFLEEVVVHVGNDFTEITTKEHLNGSGKKASKDDKEIGEFCLDFEKRLDFNTAKESISNVSDTLLNDISF